VAIATPRGPYRRRSTESGKKKSQSKYYNFAIPPSLYKAVGELAEERDTTFRGALIHLLALGYSMHTMVQNPSVSLIIRDAEGEKEATVSWGWNAYLASVFPSDRLR
jgi:hypothetical protein